MSQRSDNSRANARFCDARADELERRGDVRGAQTWRESANESREAADLADYEDRRGGRR